VTPTKELKTFLNKDKTDIPNVKKKLKIMKKTEKAEMVKEVPFQPPLV